MTRTIISNPGIAERLEQDISCFESYGFEFQRDGKDGGGVLISPTTDITPSIVSLHIQVSDVALVASIGPFLRTLVRLCVHPIDPRTLQAIVVISPSSSGCCRAPNDDNDNDDARTLAHAIHMLIRNSMGAALFLNLHVVLPPGTTCRREKVLARTQQQHQQQNNDHDGCYEYPSVTVHDYEDYHEDGSSKRLPNEQSRLPFHIDLGIIVQEPNSGVPPSIDNPLTYDCLENFDPKQYYISLNVITRMCTVRLTPLLYHLSQRLLGGDAPTRTQPTNTSISPQQQQQHSPLIMVCLEKVANLYRVIMLVRDYGGLSTLAQRNLVVVCKSKSVAKRFHSEAQTFISKNFFLEEKERGESLLVPPHFALRVVSIEEARETLDNDIVNPSQQQQHQHSGVVIGFDLHEHAQTLGHCDDDNHAKVMLGTAGAVILGYESDGIPEKLQQVVSQYVQIQSRTSVNVVAAFSIALHEIIMNDPC